MASSEAAPVVPQPTGGGVASPPWTVQRTKSGDTVVVRNSGTTSAAAELRLVEEARSTGSDIPGAPGFTNIAWLSPTGDGGVLFHESGTRLVMQFDAAMRFVRTIGARGTGPGEYDYVRGIVQGSDGSIYVARSNGNGHMYSAQGVYKQSWPALVRFATATLFARDDRGVLSFRTLLAPRGFPDSVTAYGSPVVNSAVVFIHPDSSRLDTVYAPEPPREQRMLPFKSHLPEIPGRTATARIPLVPYYVTNFSHANYWIGGDPERYSITLLKPGAPLRIESDFAPVRPSAAERQSLLENSFYRTKAAGSQMSTPLSIIPLTKPAFKHFETDADGRVWVELHRMATRELRDTIRMRDSLMRNQFIIVDGSEVPRQGAPVSPNRPSLPIDNWVEPVVYDVFAASGEFMGRLSVPKNAKWLSAKGDNVWMTVRDEYDVPTLVRYRVHGEGWERVRQRQRN
jgi:hypothetical protein